MTDNAEAIQAFQPPFNARAAVIDLLLSKGLYDWVDRTTEEGKQIADLLGDPDSMTFDAYCTKCQRETPFRIHKFEVPLRNRQLGTVTKPPPAAIFGIRAMCTRASCTIEFIIGAEAKRIGKIGQRPSMGDLALGELKPIDHALNDQDRQELTRALMLNSHDVPIAAFVYLRRVFERMIEGARVRHEATLGEIADWKAKRMDERIGLVHDQLPEIVVREKALFSILSVGLHELTEDECKLYFPTLKAVLFQMLEQEEHMRQAKARQDATSAEMKRIHGVLATRDKQP